MSEKLEIEIIEDGDGGTQSLSPQDFPNIREFNRALAQLKAEARAREFDESQAIKERKKALNEQKLQFNEQKQAKTLEIQQTKLTVQDMKARRQLEVAAGQNQRAREAELNRQNRQREMMLRHVLGAINPNSTFQYRMSSLYGLINTAGVTANQENVSPQQLQQGAFSKLNDIYSVVSGGLRNLFRQASTQFNQPQKQNAPVAELAQQSAAQQQADQEDYQPWWMTYKTPEEREKKARLDRLHDLLPKPFYMHRLGAPAPGSPVTPRFEQQKFIQALGFKPPTQTLPNLIATPAGIGGGGSVPPIAAGTSPAGIPPGGGGILNTLLSNNFVKLGLLGLAAYGVKKAFDILSSAAYALDRRFMRVIEDIRPFSSALIVSGVVSDLRMMQFNRQRAEMYGERLAEYEQSRTGLSISYERLIDTISMPLVPVMTSINKGLVELIDGVNSVASFLKLLSSGELDLSPETWLNITKLLQNLGIPIAGPIGVPDLPEPRIDQNLAANLAQFLNMPLPVGIRQDQFSFDMGP